MNDWLDPIIYFVGSGLAFFVGAAMILIGPAISPWAQGRPLRLARNIAVLVGAIFVAISAIPLDWWQYGVLGTITLVWLAREWSSGFGNNKAVVGARVAVGAVWLLAAALELPYQFRPTLSALGKPTLYLIGDSVSAGMSDADKGTWPKVLANRRHIDLQDLSKMGATVGSARKQAGLIPEDAKLVLLEIGGNDLLGSTSADQYEERLEILLTDVCRPGRTVVMIELPLPPFANRFGMIQRRLARKHDVALIPRRAFIGVLTTAGATVDGVHLTPAGHSQMADVIWQAISSAYEAE